jgi:hypothetical protein
MAKLAAMMANEGQSIVFGEPALFSRYDTFTDMMTFIANETDVMFPQLPIFNLKGGLLRFDKLFGFKDTVFEGGAGAGGSVFVFNRKYKIGFGYMTNSYSGGPGPDLRTLPIMASIVEQIKKQKEGNVV